MLELICISALSGEHQSHTASSEIWSEEVHSGDQHWDRRQQGCTAGAGLQCAQACARREDQGREPPQGEHQSHAQG